MEHTIKDFNDGGEKDLVTSPPKWPEYPLYTGAAHTNPTRYIYLTPEALRAEINKKFNSKLCNEVTITFTDKWIIPYNTTYINIKLREFLQRWTKVANYVMVQDYSQVGRLHYHGILEMNEIDKFERLIINLRKTFGKVECKQISFWESYLKYMTGLYDPTDKKFMAAIKWQKDRYMSNKIQ